MYFLAPLREIIGGELCDLQFYITPTLIIGCVPSTISR